ncbi:MAG: S8 family serine peptidase [Lactobacillaceae bacterium]|nr:S8 family serine peptidase [Lactobacillaceae bacterium]
MKNNKWSKCSAIILTAILAGNLAVPVVAVSAATTADQASGKTKQATKSTKTNKIQATLDDLTNAFKKDAQKISTTLTGADQSKPKEYIVQLDEKTAAEIAPDADGTKQTYAKINAAEDQVEADQAAEKKAIEKITDAKVEKNFTYLINGFKIKATAAEASEIKNKVENVAKVSEVQQYETTDIDANNLAQVSQVWQSTKHATKGEGMLVAVVDTGMDPNHQDMVLGATGKKQAKLTPEAVQAAVDADVLNGKGKYFSDKVPYGYNYADHEEEILDNGLGGYHGHHVSGIVGANGTAANGGQPIDGITHVDGVAPEAQIMMMKVGSNLDGHLSTDAIIEGMEDAVKLGADVINMSLGADRSVYAADDAEINAVEQAANSGVLSVISAGNSGNYASLEDGDTSDNSGFDDQRTVHEPSVAPSALSVAASYNTGVKVAALPLLNADLDESIQKIQTWGNEAFEKLIADKTADHTNDFVVVPNTVADADTSLPGLGSVADFKAVDVKDKWAVVSRGELNFTDKQDNALAAGAKGLIIIDNIDAVSPTQMQFNEGLPTFGIRLADGQHLVKYLNNKASLTFGTSFTTISVANPSVAKPTSFTSWGTGKDFLFKPEIMATGGNVWSTMNDNKYGSMSGTSMAAPFVSGSQALVLSQIKKQKHAPTGHKLIETAKLAVENTAVPAFDTVNNTYYSPRQQGTGNIQVDDAISNTTVLANKADKTGGISLKQISTNKFNFTVTLSNYGNKNAKYQLDDKYLTVSESQTTDNGNIADVALPNVKLQPSTKQVVIKPGKTVEVTFTANLKNAAKQKWVEGYVGFINAKTHKSLSIPYFGFYGDYNQQAAFDKLASQEGSIMNVGHVQDYHGVLIGSEGYYDAKNVLRISGNNPDDFWFAPTGGEAISEARGTKQAFVPWIPVTRDLEQVSAKVYNAKHKLVKHLTENNYLAHSQVNNSNRVPELGISVPAEMMWTGYDDQSQAVPDGDYTYEITGAPAFKGAKTQKVTLKARIDRVAPEINNAKLYKDANNGKYHVALDLKETASGITPDTNILFAINSNGGTPISRPVSGFTNGAKFVGEKHLDFTLTDEEAASMTIYDEANIVYLAVQDDAANFTATAWRTNADSTVEHVDPHAIRSASHAYELTSNDVFVKSFVTSRGLYTTVFDTGAVVWSRATDDLESHPDLLPSEELLMHTDPQTHEARLMIYDREQKITYFNTAQPAVDGYYMVHDQAGIESDKAVHLGKQINLNGDKPLGYRSLRMYNPRYADVQDEDNTYTVEWNGKTSKLFLSAANQHITSRSWLIVRSSDFEKAGNPDPFLATIESTDLVDEITTGIAGKETWIKLNGSWVTIKQYGVGNYEIYYMT